MVSCQNQDTNQHSEKALSIYKQIKPDQKLSTDDKNKLNIEAMKEMTKTKEVLEQGYQKANKDSMLRDQKLEVRPGPLTEEEQKFVENISDDLLMTPEALKTEKTARKYIKILLKGEHRTIRWSRAAGSENNQKQYYSDVMATALSKLNPKNKESLDLIIEVVKTKREYPKVLAEAANALGKSGDKRVVPLLQDIVKNQNADTKLNAGRALLLFGNIDTALPVLDELSKEGHTAALGSIFHNMQGKEWQQRGVGIIRKALSYNNNESKALAALFLVGLSKKGLIDDDLHKYEDMLLAMLEDVLNKKKWDKPVKGEGYSDHRALETVILALTELKSVRAIPLLKRLKIHSEASYLDRRAVDAINNIESSTRKK